VEFRRKEFIRWVEQEIARPEKDALVDIYLRRFAKSTFDRLIADSTKPEHVTHRVVLRYLSQRRIPKSTEWTNPMVNENYLGKGC
jgi:predicted HTH transcriptional regulator